jgi:hypothetical protein
LLSEFQIGIFCTSIHHVKIHCISSRQGATGAVLRDSNGPSISGAAVGYFLSSAGDASFAELMEFKTAVVLAKDIRVSNLILKTVSADVVRMFQDMTLDD